MVYKDKDRERQFDIDEVTEKFINFQEKGLKILSRQHEDGNQQLNIDL